MNDFKHRILDTAPIEVDIDIFNEDFASPRSTHSVKSTRSLKVMIGESYQDYFIKLKNVYSQYKYNHFSKYYEKVKSHNLTQLNAIQTNDDYMPSTKLFQIKINKDFFNENFTIDKVTLEKKKEELEPIIKDCIEKCGIIEMEIQRILNSSHKMYNYIERNLSLYDIVNIFLEKIKKSKAAYANLKNISFLILMNLALEVPKRQKLIKLMFSLIKSKICIL